MSTEWFHSFILRYYDAWNRRDLALVDRLTDEYTTQDSLTHSPAMPDFAKGPEAQKAFVRLVLGANPDFHMTLDDLMTDGDKVVMRMTVQGNNPTTGAIESTCIIDIIRLEGQKMAETWELFAPGAW
jgi:predicted SnoaL-like aldol condensation-catalyzing enzyme